MKLSATLANKLARIAYACLRDHAAFDEKTKLDKKIERQSFDMPSRALVA